MSLIDPNESFEVRKVRIDVILERNSQPVVCDFCGKPTMHRITNVGDAMDVVLVCDPCIKIIYTPTLK
jgi:formylmethanofuran dehydrogenase subunit E